MTIRPSSRFHPFITSAPFGAAALLVAAWTIAPAPAQAQAFEGANERGDNIRFSRGLPPLNANPPARAAAGGTRDFGGRGATRDYGSRGREYGSHRGGAGFGRAAAIGAGLGVAGAVLPYLLSRPNAAYVEDDYDDAEPRARRPRVREPRHLREPRQVQREPIQRRPPPPDRPAVARANGPQSPATQLPPDGETRFVPDEVVFEARAGLAPQALETLARRYRLTRIGEQHFSLIDATIYRYRIAQNDTVRGAIGALGRDSRVAFVQPNYVYTLQQTVAAAQGDALAAVAPTLETAPTPAQPPVQPASSTASTASSGPVQYIVDAMHLADAHKMARGDRTLVAVIDSGIDAAHQEIAGAVVKSFDTLGEPTFEPESHGTGMAGAIAAHGLLQSVAPGAQILAARAFSSTATKSGAQGTSFHISKGVDWAYDQKARIINMSFAGPRDPLLGRMIAAAAQKKMILIAAAGNAGPNSAPLFPAADPNVIAVTATDSRNQIFDGANRGAYISVAAPGVDVLVAAPKGAYEFTTGTSVATAHISGVIALMLEKNPALDTGSIRKELTDSGVSLGFANGNLARLVDPAAALRDLNSVSQAKVQ